MEQGMNACLMGRRASDQYPGTSRRASACNEASLLSFFDFSGETRDCFKKNCFSVAGMQG
jgi:hypothetical protein